MDFTKYRKPSLLFYRKNLQYSDKQMHLISCNITADLCNLSSSNISMLNSYLIN